MSTNNHKVDARITSINRKAANEWFHKAHAEDGVHFLTDTNAAPTGKYKGFVVIADATIASITYDPTFNATGDITAINFYSGYYPIRFSTITLTSGSLMLIKDI